MKEFEEIDPLGWRLSDSVVRGEIDNRQRDRVTGRIWLVDREFPLELTLRGNPMRDIAGCLLRFENPNPMPEDNEGLSPIQMGVTGLITASCKLRVLDLKAGPEADGSSTEVKRIANAIKIEWFSQANGRVAVQSTDFRMTLSDFTWRMTRAEQEQQTASNEKAYQRWRDVVAEENEDEDEGFFDDDDYGWYMDEFAWERQFQESDALTRRFMLLMETFLDHPERDRIIAHEMGWDWMDHGADALVDDAEPWEDWEEWDELPSLLPNPDTEGRDWIHTPDGNVRHPLAWRATELARAIWRATASQATAAQERHPSQQPLQRDLQSLLFQAQTLSAKLSGALDALAYDAYPDGGFVVACLKRAHKAFETTAKSLGALSQQDALPPRTIQAFRDELFQIRQEILRLMQVYRKLQQ